MPVTLLKKVAQVKLFKQFRPIALALVPRKIASYAVFSMALAAFENRDWWEYVFKPGYKTSELVLVIRLVIEKAL